MLEDLQDPRDVLLSNIDITKTRVEFSVEPIVLLFGGFVNLPKAKPDDLDPPVTSLRDAIHRSNPSYEIFRPEEITSWQADSVFNNLMEFESDLTSICTLVVIILESAGSLVELGAFSQLQDLKKKIIVVRSSDFKDDISFINHGILRYISEGHESSVKSYPWNIDKPELITDEIVKDVIFDIQEELSKLKKTEVVKLNKSSHVIVLICEIVSYFKAVKETEILNYLQLIDVKLSKGELKSKLFLLEHFQLINKEEYSDSVFYIRSNNDYHRLRLSFKDGAYPDVLRIQTECLAFYSEDNKHRNRIRVIKQAERGGRL